ncbi:MAG TPA: hypothetical protein V6D33_09080 [Cyanophyceae cyanobacterium]
MDKPRHIKFRHFSSQRGFDVTLRQDFGVTLRQAQGGDAQSNAQGGDAQPNGEPGSEPITPKTQGSDSKKRLRSLLIEISRIKKRRIALLITAAALTASIAVYFYLTNGTGKTENQPYIAPTNSDHSEVQ